MCCEDKAIEQIKRHEGLRLFPYQCTAGKQTIGYGRNIESRGISRDEAELLLKNDMQLVRDQLEDSTPWYMSMCEPRKAVFENMAFNLGITGFLRFKRMLSAAQSGNYETAASEMLDSRWSSQVGNRANELAEQMRSGEFSA